MDGPVDLGSERYRDKVMGCWVGKSAGGTLGQPLEEVFGRAEPFDVRWYPELPDGGIANDDFELHLIFLRALEEVGPDLRAADLARYWLAYTGYNWDEYGLSKANLRLGLQPPVSGAFDNWFRDCMGCSVRSEIWACIAPGDPNLAVRYAYEDAICDHAGGEGVYGELFDTAVQSAAFVSSDRDDLLDIGLSFIPAASATARAIGAAREAHAAGRSWLEARSAVLAAAPSVVAQHSPINLGFVVVGWLYGEDFGDALCKTVSCGYDTDSSGATLGATLGIVAGHAGLPARWIEPIGESIPTNEPWGGVRNLAAGPNPVPTTLSGFTERVSRVARTVRARHGADGTPAAHPALAPTEASIALWTRSPMTTTHDLGVMTVELDHGAGPSIGPGETRRLELRVTNRQPDPLAIVVEVEHPTFAIEVPERLDVPAWGTAPLTLTVEAPGATRLQNSNVIDVRLRPDGWPAPGSIPLVLIGRRRYRVSEPFDAGAMTSEAAIEHAFAPEALTGPATEAGGREGAWTEAGAADRRLPLPGRARHRTVTYVQAFLEAPRAMAVRLGVSSTAASRLWLNGEVVATSTRLPLRPSLEGYGQAYGDGVLRPGWNEVLVKVVCDPDAPAFEGYLMLSDPARLFAGITEVGWTRLPWDRPLTGP